MAGGGAPVPSRVTRKRVADGAGAVCATASAESKRTKASRRGNRNRRPMRAGGRTWSPCVLNMFDPLSSNDILLCPQNPERLRGAGVSRASGTIDAVPCCRAVLPRRSAAITTLESRISPMPEFSAQCEIWKYSHPSQDRGRVGPPAVGIAHGKARRRVGHPPTIDPSFRAQRNQRIDLGRATRGDVTG